MNPSVINELLFEDMKSGDVYAFEVLFHRYYKKLCRYGRTIISRWEIAEEIAVDVLHKLWANKSDITITTGVEQYLYRSVHNRALNYLRDAARREPEVTYVPEFAVEPSAEDRNLMDIIAGPAEASLQEQLDHLLASLSSQQQQILGLRKEGLTHKDIAGQMELPEKKVRNISDRTIQKLRAQLNAAAFLNNRLPPDLAE